VLTQDCDLENDFKTRSKKSESGVSAEGVLPNVLLCEVITVAALRITAPGSDVWRKVKANKDERYHVLESAAAWADALKEGLPPLGIDFKRYFTIPTDELYFQIGSGAKRRCRLISPYREHLSTRFSAFLARVALPLPHHIDLK
jgi:hypothetical protein